MQFFELYSAYKLAIRYLSLQDEELKYSTVYEKGNPAVDQYFIALLQLILSEPEKSQSKKW
jgi:hypothetical protein